MAGEGAGLTCSGQAGRDDDWRVKYKVRSVVSRADGPVQII